MSSNTRTNKMLVILVVVLLLTNAGMLYYFNTRTIVIPQADKEVPKTRAERQIEYMRKGLKLDSAQLVKYLQLRVDRDSVMKPMNEALRVSKMKMIGYLKAPAEAVPDLMVKKTAAEITEKQKAIEEAYYYHFRRVKALCRPDQLPLFDSIMIQMVIKSTSGDQKKDK